MGDRSGHIQSFPTHSPLHHAMYIDRNVAEGSYVFHDRYLFPNILVGERDADRAMGRGVGSVRFMANGRTPSPFHGSRDLEIF